MSEVTITLRPDGRIIKAKTGVNLMEVLRRAGIRMDFPCGGCGACGKCRVKITSEVQPPKEEEIKLIPERELKEGVRLACLYTVASDMEIEVVFKNEEARVLERGIMGSFTMDPPVKKRRFFAKDSKDALSLEERLTLAVGCPVDPECRLELLRSISRGLPEEGTAVIRDNMIAGIEEGDTTGKIYGAALDIGTTTVVLSLVNMVSGKEEAVVSALNPQKEFGQDVLSRISHAKKGEQFLSELQKSIVNSINDLLEKAVKKAGIDKKDIYEMTVAANTTMTHLFLGINPESIGSAPYYPVLKRGIDIKAQELGISISPFGRVYCLPAISGYVGGDIVAGILATGFYKKDDTALFIDIGTNGEIVFFDGREMVACSCAAGPALEGVNISCGMRAADGAVEEVRISEDVFIRTIGDDKPKGVCGSGIVDLVAELLKIGFVEPSGRMVFPDKARQIASPNLAARLVEKERSTAFIIAYGGEQEDDVFITSRDIRQVQLAKGAIWAGIRALLREKGISPKDVRRVYVAGAFGAHLRPESLSRIGMIAGEWTERLTFAGNTSIAGATMCLLSGAKRKEAENIAGMVRYLELSTMEGFDRLFAESLKFPEGDRSWKENSGF
ncbi:ASKHA domain-containing protein [Thermosediminibacter oceani]|uniref:Ferredoxin n=1 Tax=Thermosediminibacter oceani (strain ATCC BAA-1034 / DSM 16646 / JW/IW-1228P) TaxID=555079 RepID=D9S251_THEOJ|nr:ASKHA domain-containing protein [Thermosediminibacter oceani]ADL07478.1 ferredoxin [Thermosediminibacter oceani DSM 16646]